MKKLLLLLSFSISAIAVNAQTWADTVQAIEKLFERYKPSIPGAQLAISRNGKIIYSKAWGMADMEHNIAMTITSPSEAGSVSKQFTAAAILLLEQQGKLSLNDDVRKHLPEMPDYGATVTLRQMMQHTSGLKDWGSIAALAGWARSTKTYNNNDALYLASLQKTLNNKPGSEFLYSNSNYNLFAVIVERVSGMSLADFTKKHIFDPAGMRFTQWRNDFRTIVPNRALAYSKSAQGYYTNMPNEYVYGNGGLLTTAEDLLAWNNYYLEGRFGNPSLLPKQIATNAFNNGVMNAYAAGLFIRKYNGVDHITHDGATAGYRANLDHFPSLGLSIAFLSNTSEFDASPNIVNPLRNIFVKPVPGSNTTNNNASYTVTPETLNSYAGWYKNTRSGAGLKLFVRDGKLHATQGIGALTPVAEHAFAIGNNRLQLVPGHKGFVYINASNDSIYFMPVDSVAFTPARMNDYVGEYYSDEVEARFYVTVKNDKLVLSQKIPVTEITLTPTYTDAFDSGSGAFGVIYFERDKKNKVNGFKVSVGRARNVSFRKVK
jgi:CubicO group peptidase (beta-lactamase class C family)